MAEENPKEKEEKEGDEDVSEEEVDEEELERQRLAAADAASDDLLAASAKNDLGAALKALSIASEVDRVDGKGATSLGWAALHGNVRLVDALLEKNAHKQYLEACAMREKQELREEEKRCEVAPKAGAALQELLDSVDDGKGAHLLRNTPLHLSAFKGHLASALSLLDAGYSLRDVDDVGNTALHLGCASHSLAMVELLLGSGADVDKENNFHLTPLDIATDPDVRAAVKRAVAASERRKAEELRAHEERARRMLQADGDGSGAKGEAEGAEPTEAEGAAVAAAAAEVAAAAESGVSESVLRVAAAARATRAAREERQAEGAARREEKSRALRGATQSLQELLLVTAEAQPAGEPGGGDAAAKDAALLRSLQKAKSAAEATAGAVSKELIDQATQRISRYQLSIQLRERLAATKAQHPIVTQR